MGLGTGVLLSRDYCRKGIVTLQPGIYTLGGGATSSSGLILKDGAVVTGQAVMFHIVGKGQVSVGNNAILHATAPASGDYKGFQFFQSRQNVSKVAVFKGVADSWRKYVFPRQSRSGCRQCLL